MSFAEDLLAQADHLANLDAGRPKQANLRRAIFAAYYALMVAESVRRVGPKSPGRLAHRIARAFSHAEMRQFCRAISEEHKSLVFEELQPEGLPASIRFVALKFVELQERRHLADYDLSATFTRVRVLETLELARSAMAAWKNVRSSEEAYVFLAALLFGSRWAK